MKKIAKRRPPIRRKPVVGTSRAERKRHKALDALLKSYEEEAKAEEPFNRAVQAEALARLSAQERADYDRLVDHDPDLEPGSPDDRRADEILDRLDALELVIRSEWKATEATEALRAIARLS